MYRVVTEPGHPKVIIAGPHGRFVFKVFNGRITRDVWTALKGLQLPALRRQVKPGFDITIPYKHRSFDNRGENRRFMLLRPAGKAATELVLVSRNQSIPRSFERDLRDALEERIEPGTTSARIRKAAQESGRRGGLAKKEDAA